MHPDQYESSEDQAPLPTRREALHSCAVVAATVGLGRMPLLGATPQRLATASATSGDEALDEALRLLHSAEPKCKQGLSTHAPMVAEALCVLGHADRAVKWVENYNAPWIEIPAPSTRIEAKQWRSALGPKFEAASWEAQLARFGDWKEFFVNELAEAHWQDVLDQWTSRLAPGICGAATHGVIRTAHAASGLGRKETPERRAELARGLAYWAVSYQELPVRARQAGAGASYEKALEQVPLYFEAHHAAPQGNIVQGFRDVAAIDDFAQARDLAAVPDDVPSALSALSATFAHIYLRSGTQHNAIAFVHAVTGPCALRRLAPHIKPETARAALPYAWQAAAGVYAAYARKSDSGKAPDVSLSRDELVTRAIDNGAEHAIKFTEVLLAEHAIHPDPVYLAAAQDGVGRL